MLNDFVGARLLRTATLLLIGLTLSQGDPVAHASARGEPSVNIIAVPTVTGVAPNAGPLGGMPGITIIGTGFALGDVVKFGGVVSPFPFVIGPTTIVAAAPPSGAPGAVHVTVTNGDDAFLN